MDPTLLWTAYAVLVVLVIWAIYYISTTAKDGSPRRRTTQELMAEAEAREKKRLEECKAILSEYGFGDADPVAEIIARTKDGRLEWRMSVKHPLSLQFDADISADVRVEAQWSRHEFQKPDHTIICYALMIFDKRQNSSILHEFYMSGQTSDYNLQVREFVKYLMKWFSLEIPKAI